jgi:hypothetical protein
MCESIIIDKKVAQQIVHEANHLDWQWVPEDVLAMKVTLKTGTEIGLGKLIEQTQSRVDVIANYLRVALKHERAMAAITKREWRTINKSPGVPLYITNDIVVIYIHTVHNEDADPAEWAEHICQKLNSFD